MDGFNIDYMFEGITPLPELKRYIHLVTANEVGLYAPTSILAVAQYKPVRTVRICTPRIDIQQECFEIILMI